MSDRGLKMALETIILHAELGKMKIMFNLQCLSITS